MGRVDDVKKDRGFKVWDIVVYVAVAAGIVAIFLAVFFTSDRNALSGVSVYYRNDLIFEAEFSDLDKMYLDESYVSIAERTDEKLVVDIRTSRGYNEIEIDLDQKCVSVTDADCGGKDCVRTSAITDNSGIIYCSPHYLTITPLDADTTEKKDDGIIII